MRQKENQKSRYPHKGGSRLFEEWFHPLFLLIALAEMRMTHGISARLFVGDFDGLQGAIVATAVVHAFTHIAFYACIFHSFHLP